MADVDTAVSDLEMIGGEIAWLVSDLPKHIESHNWPNGARRRFLAASAAADAVRLRLVAIRESLGLKPRP